MNLGISPATLGKERIDSPVIRREIRKLKVLCGRLKRIGPINSEEKARQYRTIYAKYCPELAETYKVLGLSF